MANDPELLIGLSDGELQALAETKLAISTQARLDQLLVQNVTGSLSTEEEAELDRLLARIDHLNIHQARAKYTLRHQPRSDRT